MPEDRIIIAYRGGEREPAMSPALADLLGQAQRQTRQSAGHRDGPAGGVVMELADPQPEIRRNAEISTD